MVAFDTVDTVDAIVTFDTFDSMGALDTFVAVRESQSEHPSYCLQYPLSYRLHHRINIACTNRHQHLNIIII